MHELGNAIKLRREFLNIKQEDLAELGGIAIKTIHLVESGIGNPSYKTLQKISDVLGMELLIKVKVID
ncbi:helix-turn-helix transcriptional regulator [Chitinophaga cymbidii]